MAALPNSVRVPFTGRVNRDGPHLVPHSMAFPSAMMSLKLFLGGKHRTHELSAHNRTWRSDEDYYLHLGISGEGFRFLFDTAEYFRFREEAGARPLCDCFAMEGIPVKLYAAKQVQGIDGVWCDERHMKEMVLNTLVQGWPVMLLGRTASDWVVLATGFEEGGETLAGWTFVPGADMSNKSFAPEDCQYIKDWASGADAVALVTNGPTAVQGREEIILRALNRGKQYLQSSIGHPNGREINFYSEWTSALLDNAYWSKAFSGRPRIDPDIWDLAERRAFVAEFLEEAGQMLKTEALLPASQACHRMHDLMWQINSLCDGEGGQAKLKDPAVRREIVSILNTCRSLDHQAAEVIGKILE